MIGNETEEYYWPLIQRIIYLYSLLFIVVNGNTVQIISILSNSHNFNYAYLL